MAWFEPALCPDCGEDLRRGLCARCAGPTPAVTWTCAEGGPWTVVARLALAPLYLASAAALGLAVWALLAGWASGGFWSRVLQVVAALLVVPLSPFVVALLVYLAVVHPFALSWRYQSADGRRSGTVETLLGRVRSAGGVVTDADREALEAPPALSSLMLQRAGVRFVRRALLAGSEPFAPMQGLDGPALLVVAAMLNLQRQGHLSLQRVSTRQWTRTKGVVERWTAASSVEVTRDANEAPAALPWLEGKLLGDGASGAPPLVEGLSLPYRASAPRGTPGPETVGLGLFLARAFQGLPRPGRSVVEGVRADPTGEPQVPLQEVVTRLGGWCQRDPEVLAYVVPAVRGALRS
ncbi:MAG: hypothetical protein HY909_00955 [Deltaproteobacteria bacterium]|nr:hypothetical protein [Deltaproteobacteria bacterium]